MPASRPADAGEQNQPLLDPELPDDDPRQLLFGLLKGSGITFTLSAAASVEDVLRAALRTAPILGRSRHLGRGFLVLDDDPATVWAAVEGPRGAAVLVFGSPDSNTDLLFDTITTPFQACAAPFVSALVFSGSAEPRVKAIVDGADVVPAWEVAEFRSLAPAAGQDTLLPASVRRTVRSWERVAVDVYRRDFADRDGDAVAVFVTIADGQPKLLSTMAGLPESSIRSLGAQLASSVYTVDEWDDMTVVTRPFPPGADLPTVVDLSQAMVDDVTIAIASLGDAAPPEVPAASAASTVWERLEIPGPGGVAARSADWPSAAFAYTTTERVRESVAGEGSLFTTLDRLARRLRARRGSGFEYSWRASADVLLSPSWITLRSAKVDVESGRIVGCGHLAHEAWNLPPAYDLGAIDGRNLSSFPADGHGEGLMMPAQALYIGTLASGTIVPVTAAGNLISVDLYGPDGSIACLEFLGSSTGAISVYDRGRARRLVTIVEGIAGNESIAFSGDGQWLLISRSRDSVLVHAPSGRWTTLEVANVCWWPLDGSSLLTVEHENGAGTPRLFSLADNGYTRSFPPIVLDVPPVPDFPYFWHPAVSPDARELLVLTPAGVTPSYQQKNGTGNHLARVDLASGRGTLESSVYLDDYLTMERDVSEARWVGRAPRAPLTLHPDRAAMLDEPVLEHPFLGPARWADGAERILVLTLNTMITLTQEGKDIAHLVPEALASLAVVARDDEIMARQGEWLTGLQAATNTMVANGSAIGRSATAWRRYGAAIAAVQAGRPDLIDPLDATWA